MSREAIFSALFARAQAITWTDPVSGQTNGWVYTNRRIVTPDQVGSDQQPALFQAEADEQFSQTTKMPTKRILSGSWLIYLKAYDAPQPTGPLINAVMDGVEQVLQADDLVNDVCTLGGLVNHVWIDGMVFKDTGDLDGQAMLIVPIRILVP